MTDKELAQNQHNYAAVNLANFFIENSPTDWFDNELTTSIESFRATLMYRCTQNGELFTDKTKALVKWLVLRCTYTCILQVFGSDEDNETAEQIRQRIFELMEAIEL